VSSSNVHGSSRYEYTVMNGKCEKNMKNQYEQGQKLMDNFIYRIYNITGNT